MNDLEFDRLLRRHLHETADPDPTRGLLHDVLGRVSGVRQARHGWALRSGGVDLGARWRGMATGMAVVGLAVLLAALAIIAGSPRPSPTLPSPRVRPASNGLIVVLANGRLTAYTPDLATRVPFVTDDRQVGGMAWAVDGTRFAYWAAPGDLEPSDLVVTDAHGLDPVVVARGLRPNHGRIAWAPDGSSIAIAEMTSASCCSGDPRVSLLDLRGSPRPGVGYPSRTIGQGTDPAFSPDGRWVAYHATDGLHLASADEPSDRLLAPDATEGRWIHWTPDSRAVEFAGPGGPWIVSAPQGGDRRTDRVLSELGAEDPVWTRDGSAVAWTGDAGLMVAAADGSNPRRIAGSVGLRAPFWWSPDGTVLVATRWALPPGTVSALVLLDPWGGALAVERPFDGAQLEDGLIKEVPVVAWRPIE